MKKLNQITFLIIVLLLSMYSLGDAFTVSEWGGTMKRLQLTKEAAHKFNKQIADARDTDLLLYGLPHDPFSIGYVNRRLEVYKNTYGPEFEISLETGTGKVPNAFPDGSKILWYFTGWRLTRMQYFEPTGIVEDFQFDPGFTVVNYTITGPAGKIVIRFNLHANEAQVVDVSLPYITTYLNLSQSQRKGVSRSYLKESQDFISSTTSAESTDTTKESRLMQNVLIPLVDKYIDICEKQLGLAFLALRSIVTGEKNDELLQFVKANLKDKSKDKKGAKK